MKTPLSAISTDGRVVAVLQPRIEGDRGLWGALCKATSYPAMLMTCLFLYVVRLAERNLPDPDIWWHLRNAQYLFTHHRLPNFDTYSFTVAGHPWMNYEWLGEIPYYLAWRVWGLEGVEAVMLLVLEAICLGLLFLCYQQSRHIKASALACWFGALLSTVNFGPRTILFGYALLLVLMATLQRFRRRGNAPLWILPPLFCLWINTHGSWSLGIVFFAIFIAAGLVEGNWGRIEGKRWTRQDLRSLLWSFAASCAALFLNPYGYRMVTYPLDMAFRQQLNIASIQEWQTIDFHGVRGKVVLVLLAGLFCSALASRYKWRLADLLMLLFAFYSGLTYERFLFLAGIIAAPILAEMLYFVPPYQPKADNRWINAAIIAGLLGYVVYHYPTPARLEAQVDEIFPAEVMPYLQSHKLSGEMLNFYDWGGYLGWKDPNVKVFVDSRVDIYEHAGVFADYVATQTLSDPLRILDKYRIRYVLYPPGQPLTYLLSHDSHWRVVFSGRITTLLERIRPGGGE